METIIGFILGATFVWYVIPLMIFGFFLDHEEHPLWVGGITVLGIVGILLAFGITIPPHLWVVSALGYLVVGLVWSIWRYRLFVLTKMNSKYGARITTSFKTACEADNFVYLLRPANQKTRIVGWMAAWPVNILQLATCDLLDWVYESFSGVFNRIYASITAEFLKPPVETATQPEREA